MMTCDSSIRNELIGFLDSEVGSLISSFADAEDGDDA